MTLTFGSLFSGIGGLDLGLERAGMECRWQSEIEPYCCRVLAKHWPNIPNLGDINGIEWERVEPVDLICGGYPCQPFSVAGARNGNNDPRHLWPRFFDAVRILRPRFALLENVTGHLSLGFGHVLADLASIGYDTEWDCIPAASVGAPHLRERVFVIASRRNMVDSNETSRGTSLGTVTTTKQRHCPDRFTGEQMERWSSQRGEVPQRRPRGSHWQTEPDVGRMADGIPNRMDRLGGLGNAVVPQVAEHVANILIHNHLQLVANANDPRDLK